MGGALITGASSGIGYEFAKIFAKNSIDIALVARSEDKMRQLKSEIEKDHQVRIIVLPKDISKVEACKEIYDELKSQKFEVEYLINNTGFGDYGEFLEGDWQKERAMIDLNITSLTYLSKLFGRDMRERKSGRIMNVASTASFQPGPLMSVYFATKAYALHFSEAIASEMKKYGITVTALCPGATLSGFQSVAGMEKSRLLKMKKLPTSKEVAEYGYKKMMQGKTVAIHGFVNFLLATSVRFFPRKVVVAVTRLIQGKTN